LSALTDGAMSKSLLCLGWLLLLLHQNSGFSRAGSGWRHAASRLSSLVEDVSPAQTFLVPIINRGRLEISVDSPYGDVVKSRTAAKAELLDIVSAEIGSLDAHYRLEYLVKVLAKAHTPVQTIPFLNMVLEGRWAKKYSNTHTPRAVQELNYEIHQTVTVGEEILKGVVKEEIDWSYEEGGQGAEGKVLSDGVLEVLSHYSINSKGHLTLELQEHVLRAKNLPVDVEEFLNSLQKTVPFESFDPNMTAQENMVSCSTLLH
jgi:hypothetical protein